MLKMLRAAVLAAGLAVVCTGPVAAETAANRAPRDVAYPGTITLSVDVSDLDHRVFSVKQRIPVSAGPLTLLYPEWLQGNHAPRGPIDALGGLTITANGKRLEWTRDPLDVFAFLVTVPEGVSELGVEFQYASPVVGAQGRTVATPDMVGLQWNAVVLYPAGYFAKGITVEPSITLPQGWEYAVALDGPQRSGDIVKFAPTSLEMLLDSPLFAGRHFKRVDLTPSGKRPVNLNIVADQPLSLDIKPNQLAAHRKMVAELYALFGSEHYDRYEFLFALTEHLGGVGLEHHRSSENSRTPGYFTEWDKTVSGRDLLPHEMTHSWNGKFRRPAGLVAPNHNTPLQNELLWVYEGGTNYWGYIISARSGLWTDEIGRQAWAVVAAVQDRNRPGRTTRTLQDTVNQPIMTSRRPLSFTSLQRTEDYYTEGQLVWLDVDTKIRELSKDKRTLDDFAKAFFGVQDGQLGPLPYTFEDVVAALNGVVAFDWSTFLKERLLGHGPGAPLDGLTRGGWKLVYTDTPSEYFKSREESGRFADHTFSLGVAVSTRDKGQISEVRWGSPAFEAGLIMGTTIVAVNGVEYKPEGLKAAITAARGGNTPIELIVKNFDRYRTVKIPYYGGLQYPTLERIPGTRDRFSEITKPRT